MDFPLNKLPPPKYTDKPSKHKEKKKTVLVSNIDQLFDGSFIKNYFPSSRYKQWQSIPGS